MCACDWNYLCMACRDTRLDGRWMLEPDPAERELERREAAISRPDFQRPGGTGA